MEIDRWIAAVSAVMRMLNQSVVAKLSICLSVHLSALTNVHELWVMTQRIRSATQVAKMSSLGRVVGLSLRDEIGRAHV